MSKKYLLRQDPLLNKFTICHDLTKIHQQEGKEIYLSNKRKKLPAMVSNLSEGAGKQVSNLKEILPNNSKEA
jgi:hypothetical protein